MLFKAILIAVVCSMVVAQSDFPVQQETARFLALQVTKTTVQLVTVTVDETKKSLCANLVDVTGACQRRKRGMDKPIILSFDNDDIDLYHPSPVQQVEATPAVDLDAPGRVEILESSSETPVEVDIVGLQSECYGRRFGLVSALASGVASVLPEVSSDLASSLTSVLNLTLRFKTTLTATVTVTNTVTDGSKAFVVSGCTPSPFLYQTC
ncbi:Uncharacterized protein APZ42_017395 [Daphnia magna]|uniref:Uncharacterized protein n=2 Tax=Daphnia magna TaxID=35525 RepID=A0ABR0ANP1_9CRUS|nr:hypothetical protein OUZ56_015764 [Daphnia magna]KZS16786.1 Uncharacterized protein APZ42_017395 [Daphnia magna]